jgi:hypothetical protein
VLVRIRVSVPDRPGALGQVASTIGQAGADVVQVEVLSAENGRAVDDVHVRVHDTAHLDRLVQGLSGTPGVVVDGVMQSPPPVTGHAELELVARLVQQPARALRTLVDGVPAAIGADWAAVLSGAGEAAAGALDVVDTLELAGVRAPGAIEGIDAGLPLRVGSPRVRLGGGRTAAGTALVPIGSDEGIGLLVVREDGPAFHRAETFRLAEIGRVVGAVLRPAPVLH